MSGVVAAAGFVRLVGEVGDTTSGWARFMWPAVALFVAWRFLRLGVYTSDWGVRICNPALTRWFRWHKIDHFELASTGEMFVPKAKVVSLVSRRGSRIRAYGLSTSGIPFRLSEEGQAEILADLNARLVRV